MKKVVILLAFISAIVAVILAVTPLSKLAYIPGICSLIFGILGLYLSKGEKSSKRTLQLVFLMTIIALGLTTYKAIFNTVEVGDTQELQDKEAESEEAAIDELNDLDIED